MAQTVDLFEMHDLLPTKVRSVLGEMEESYESLKKSLAKLKPMGYTFDYYLDAMPYNLRKTKQNKMKPLFLILQKKWFDQIKSGEKREEYREAKPYWVNRIEGREYSHIIFQNGYASDAPRIEIEYKGYYKKKLKHEFFNNKQVTVYALKLGKILK
jgi:hypothetical protein